MQVVDQEHDRLRLRAQLEQPPQECEESALADGGLELQCRRVRIGDAKEVEDQRAVLGKAVVEQRQLTRDLLSRLARAILFDDPEQVAQELRETGFSMGVAA